MKTLRQHIKKLTSEQYDELSNLCYSSRKLYNSALWILNKYFEETNKYLGYSGLYFEMKTNEHYKAMNSKMAQQILRMVDKNFRSFFALMTKKSRGEYNESVKSPHYKPKGSKYILVLPNDGISLKNNILKITKKLRLPFSYKIDGVIKQVIIKPSKIANYYILYIQYEEVKQTIPEPNKSNVLGIDLGLNNFISCVTNIGHSFIMNGRPLKAYNQFYNKRKAKIQSELEGKNKARWSKKLERLTLNRSNYIENYLNQSVALVAKHCIEFNIGTVVCGYNQTWKQGIDLGNKTNQSFTNIPFASFKRKLENKCGSLSIDFILQEETYTSKCSFLDKETVEKHETYLGKRVKRGLFKTLNGILCNADVQAAGNIIRKAVPNVRWIDGIEGCIVSPLVLKHCF